ncbi:MAG: GAF domain-containing sensor histidine kinase [Cyanobacteriota bacterium]
MSWKFLITCFILLIIGFTGLQIIDQRIVDVNKKITSIEKQIYIDNFKININNYFENLKVNLSLLQSLNSEQITRKWLAEFVTNYASLYPAFDSLYLINNNKIEYPFSKNYKHLITDLTYDQKVNIKSDLEKALNEDIIILSKPLNFFNDNNLYVLFYIPIQSPKKSNFLLAIFNLNQIIDRNINSITGLGDVYLNIRTVSDKLIYGNNLENVSGDRIIIEGIKTPVGEWELEIVVKKSQQFYYLRQLIWVLGFALLAFLVFYMLNVDRKNAALTQNFNDLKNTELKLKTQYKRELFLRRIIEKIHTEENFYQLLDYFCSDLREFLNLDCIAFFELNPNPKVKKSYINQQINQNIQNQEIPKNSSLYNLLIKEKKLFMSNDIFKNNSTEDHELVSSNFKVFKSAMFIPLTYNDEVIGLFYFANKDFKDFENNDEIDFIQSVLAQIAIAMYQADLHLELDTRSQTIIESISQDQCLKNIVQVIRTSLNLNEMAYFVDKEIATFLKVEKAFIIELIDSQEELLSFKGEFNNNENLKKITHFNKFYDQFKTILTKVPSNVLNRQLVYPNAEDFYKEYLNSTQDSILAKEFQAKSFVSTPIYFQNKLFGFLTLTNITSHFNLKPSELEFLLKVSEQLAIAMYQIKLYEELKKFTDKQVITNKIFEVIRSSIDIDEILWNSVHEIGIYLQTDRCGIIEYNPDSYKTSPYTHEYLSKREYKSARNFIMSVDPDNSYAFHCLLNEKRPFVLDDISELTDTHDSSEIMLFLKQYNVKSFLVLPITYVNDVLAFLMLCQCETTRRWNDSDIYFLKTITNQIAIGMHQAKLFYELNQANKKLLDSYKKEQTVRKILEVIRSSFDLKEIFKDITHVIGVNLEVNRCYFMEYDIEKDKFLPPEIEYKSGDDVKSMIGREITQNEIKISSNLLKKRSVPFVIDNFEEFNIPNMDFKTAQEVGTKSLVIVPVINQDMPLGVFIVSQTDKIRTWTIDEIEVLRVIADHLAIAISQIKMYEYVRETSRLKSEFLASVSHELKTPLNSIIVLSELMQDDSSTKSVEERIELLKIIHSSGQELLEHINNILDMAKVEFTKKKANYKNFDIKELAKEIQLLTQPIADDKKINLNLHFDENLPDQIFSDRELIKFILNNLMNNAIKFTNEGFVELNVKIAQKNSLESLNLQINNLKNDNYLILSVKDSGIGIDEQYHSQIFDEFRQIEDAEVRKYSGTGLGLSICKKSVDILNGEIIVKSSLGSGSEFTVIIPLNI